MKKAAQLKADSQQKIVMKFQVQSISDKSLLSPHQVKQYLIDETVQQYLVISRKLAVTYIFFALVADKLKLAVKISQNGHY